MGSARVFATQPMKMPQKSAASVNNGSIKMHANTRVAARYLYGSTAEAVIASICSVTFMDPSSAPIPAPARPLTTNPVITGPLSLTMENTMMAGRNDLAPNRTRLSRVSSDSTTPMADPASATNGRESAPRASHCRISPRHSYGGVMAAFTSRTQKIPSSPNHSRPDISQVATIPGLAILGPNIGAGTVCGRFGAPTSYRFSPLLVYGNKP